MNELIVSIVDQNGLPVEGAVVINPETKLDDTIMATAVMDQVHKAFVPDTLVVPKNALVSFPNSDNIRHHVYSFSEPKRFEIRLYADQPEEPVRFNEAGIVTLGCNIHDSMVGYVVVSEWSYYGITNADGQMTLAFEGDKPSNLKIWHPRLADAAHFTTKSDIEWTQTGTALRLQIKQAVPSKKTSRFRYSSHFGTQDS